jgi:hypothetical protein
MHQVNPSLVRLGFAALGMGLSVMKGKRKKKKKRGIYGGLEATDEQHANLARLRVRNQIPKALRKVAAAMRKGNCDEIVFNVLELERARGAAREHMVFVEDSDRESFTIFDPDQGDVTLSKQDVILNFATVDATVDEVIDDVFAAHCRITKR